MKLARRLRPLPRVGETTDNSQNGNGDDDNGGLSNSDDSLSFEELASSSSRNGGKKKKSSSSNNKKKERGGGSSMKRSSSRGSSSALPTIYPANKESFSDMNYHHTRDHHDDSDSDSDSNNNIMNILDKSEEDKHKDEQRRRSIKQDQFVPAQLQLNNNNNSSSSKSKGGKNNKKSSSSSSSTKKKKSTTLSASLPVNSNNSNNKNGGGSSSNGDNANWDDDAITSALHKSMMVDGTTTDATSATTTKKKKSSSSRSKGNKKDKNGNSGESTTTADNSSGNTTNNNNSLPWNCPACTYKNEPLHLVCAVCGTANAVVPVAASGLNHSGGSSGGYGFGSQTRYGSSENLAGSMGNSLTSIHRRSSSESLNRSYYNNNNNHDPHRHRSMGSSSDFDNNNNNSLLRSSGGQYDDYYDSRRRTTVSSSGHDDYYNNGRDDYGYNRRGSSNNERGRYAQSMQVSSSGGGMSSFGGGGGGSVSSGRHNNRRSRRNDYYDDDSSRRSRNSRDDYYRGSSSKDYRKSTMMDMEYNNSGGYGGGGGGSSVGRYRNRSTRDDYSDASESLGTKGRITGGQYYDEGSVVSEMSDDETLLDDTRTVKTMQTIKDMVIPKGEVTIIYTDVQGSTALWEADPMSMKKATDIHDSIIRRCYSDYKGYEITTEGDAFNIAFQHPSDAIAFALKAQLALYRAKWPEGTLNHPDGCDNEKKKFRGFRVRFGMHHGPTTSTVHKTTGRTTYQGEAVEIAKAIEKMSHGGQILTTVETWRTVSGMAEQLLGSPQVMDCGEHLLWDPKKSDIAKKKASSKKVLSKRIVQLVPNSLSYDFFAARGGQEVKEGETPQKVCGRVFPPLLSHGQLSTSFLNAPYIGNKVAMVFVYTDKMEAITDRERKKNYKILAKYVRSHLMRLSPPGYECQEDKGSWMLAFDRIDNGINFGLDLKENVMKNAKLLGDVDKSQVFRVGIHWGPFLSMGPHTVTGHADYFGPIVNRAARVAAQCEPGQVCVGVPMGTDEEPPDPGPTVEVDVLGVKQLKGISIEMAIFGCRKKEKETKGEGGDETA